MRTEQEIRERIEHMRKNLLEWQEPLGLLVPTEPDADERRAIRRDLRTHIATLQWCLGAEVQR